MRRLHRKVPGYKKELKGEITIFLSLIFILLLSLVSALIESASIRIARNNRRADLSLALESVFAEYDVKLFETYHIFALEGAYGTDSFSYETILERLRYYGADSTENEIGGARFLTDGSGQEFYRLAVQYEADFTGLDHVLGKEESKFWEEKEGQTAEYEEETKEILEEITGKLGDAGETLPEEGNPIQLFSNWKQTGILSLLISDTSQLSNKALSLEQLPSQRQLREGVGTVASQEMVAGLAGKALFGSYLSKHFSCYTNCKAEQKLSYEMEYLIGGKKSDKENLEQVLGKMLLLRFPINYIYLFSDTAKQAEAEAMAAGLCTVLTVPGITELVKHAILLAWSYGESVMDLRTLIKGEKVASVKTAENWQLQLSSLAHLPEVTETQTQEEGLSYEEYLKILLMLGEKETMSMRALDLIENQLQLPMDHCITNLRVTSTCSLRRGLFYEFETSFAYQ